MRVVIMGPQGSGKSTQGKLLSGKLAVPHISTGDIFRDLSMNPTDELSRRVKERLDAGHLVDFEDTVSVVIKRLSQEDVKKGFVLDGFPRDINQANAYSGDFDMVIFLRVSDPVSTKRLLERKREDDTVELITERLKEYHTRTEPVLDYYRRKGVLVEIDGEKSVENIAEEIFSCVSKLKE